MGYNLLKNGISWGYNPLTNLLLTSWDIQVRDTPKINNEVTFSPRANDDWKAMYFPIKNVSHFRGHAFIFRGR